MIRLINYTALACSSVIFLQLVKLAWALATTSHSARGSEHVSMPTVSWPTGWKYRTQRSFKQACDDRTLAQVSLTKKGFWCSGQFTPFSQDQRVVIPNNPYHMSVLIANVDVLRPDRRQWVYTSNAYWVYLTTNPNLFVCLSWEIQTNLRESYLSTFYCQSTDWLKEVPSFVQLQFTPYFQLCGNAV